MITDTLAKISTVAIITIGQLVTPIPPENVLASHEMSLQKRYYPVQKENILLNMAYLDGRVKSRSDINWDEVQKPFKYEFKLDPQKTFAFHDDVLPEYEEQVVKTSNSHFMADEGYKSWGYLAGDGVCHLASLIYWAALDAGLEVKAPTNHNFMAIPEIDKKYGVSIYANPDTKRANDKQNLYITNNKEKPITFKFEYDGDKIKVSILE